MPSWATNAKAPHEVASAVLFWLLDSSFIIDSDGQVDCLHTDNMEFARLGHVAMRDVRCKHAVSIAHCEPWLIKCVLRRHFLHPAVYRELHQDRYEDLCV